MQTGGEARYADLFAQFAASDGRQTDLVFKVDDYMARKCWMPPADNAPKAWLVWGDEKAGGGFGAWLGAVRPLT